MFSIKLFTEERETDYKLVMCETSKEEVGVDETPQKKPDRRSYYYDDAHGYKDYDPAEESDDDDTDESA